MTGVTAEAVAAEARKSTRAVHSWEQEARQPRDFLSIAKIYADLTGVSLSWLLTGMMSSLEATDPIRSRCFQPDQAAA